MTEYELNDECDVLAEAFELNDRVVMGGSDGRTLNVLGSFASAAISVYSSDSGALVFRARVLADSVVVAELQQTMFKASTRKQVQAFRLGVCRLIDGQKA